MKKLISLILCLAVLAAVPFMTGCGEKKYAPEGPTDVNYGEVSYVPYDDGTAVTFSYLDCFVRSSEEEEAFVANTADDKGVLTYEFYDSFIDYENSTAYYKVPTRKYAEIAAYTDEEALEYLKIALGMVDSQNAEYTVDDFKFEKFDNYVCLSISSTAEYKKTGEIEKTWLVKYVVENERVYTVQGFAPLSCETKYGPVFKDVAFDVENALTQGVN